MTSTEIRQSFLDFFKSKGHTIVPSSSLLPDSPGLLFTNAGMNQFVPIFLNERAPDVDKWPGAVAGKPTRAADTQKCIRAGGKHNDLEDVGLDTYHHTFFEMLGNWSFGDYFKKEAVDWAWELVTEVWKFPPQRLYATVYNPDKSKNDPSDFDHEASKYWAAKFSALGLDPKVHVVPGSKKDNFWMMGETGPCGPCSEIHVDLTLPGETKGALVNKGDARCIEIWNLVFIQFNANADGTFSPLPARHVDTGMGFERVTGIMQNTRGFTDFSRVISNYETDIFRPLFDQLEKLSGQKYRATLPHSSPVVLPGGTAARDARQSDRDGRAPQIQSAPLNIPGSAVVSTAPAGVPPAESGGQIKIDIAFRVIADHIRTLSFSIADGILPGNNDRNYVLRRILRRAVRYGRTLGFHEPFFYKLVDTLVVNMGNVFPELRTKQGQVEEVIRSEEEAFNKTLDRGIEIFNEHISTSAGSNAAARTIPGSVAFMLYDTYGFPLDLTELMARERGWTVDSAEFDKLMDEQRARGRAAQKKEIIAASTLDTSRPTHFIGFEQTRAQATVLEAVRLKDKMAVTVDTSPFYAEMGGQVGDTGELAAGGKVHQIVNTQKTAQTFLHLLAGEELPPAGTVVELRINLPRRAAIQRHHTVTHLLHWALHEIVSSDATQKGSYVGPDKLTFDFSSPPLSPGQIGEVEMLVNERILENAGISWTEVPYAEVKGRKDIMQFFGEKYGDYVRVVQIGGKGGSLDGYSMELCGGTHTRATGEIGLFRILSESAVAAGIRRIEAVAGLRAYEKSREDTALISTIAGKVNSPAAEMERKIDALLAQQKDLEKQLQATRQKQAMEAAHGLMAKATQSNATPSIIEEIEGADGDFLQAVADALKGRFKGVVVLGATHGSAVALVATVSPEFTVKFPAGKMIQAIAPLVGGKGGGKPDNARGGGKDVAKLGEALAKAKALVSA